MRNPARGVQERLAGGEVWLDGARIDKLLLQKLPETDGEDLAV